MTASQWQPEREQLQQLAQYLNDSLSGRDQNVRKKAELVSDVRTLLLMKLILLFADDNPSKVLARRRQLFMCVSLRCRRPADQSSPRRIASCEKRRGCHVEK